MSRRCELNLNKEPLSGHAVSHSNIKTKRRFLPNLQIVRLKSDVLNEYVKMRVSARSIKSVEHSDGLDSYLLNAPDKNLSPNLRKIKKRIKVAKGQVQAQ